MTYDGLEWQHHTLSLLTVTPDSIINVETFLAVTLVVGLPIGACIWLYHNAFIELTRNSQSYYEYQTIQSGKPLPKAYREHAISLVQKPNYTWIWTIIAPVLSMIIFQTWHYLEWFFITPRDFYLAWGIGTPILMSSAWLTGWTRTQRKNKA